MSLFSSYFKISPLSLPFSSLIMLCYCFCYFVVITHRSPRFCSFFSILFALSSDLSAIELTLSSLMTFLIFSILPINLSREILILVFYFSVLKFSFTSISLLRFPMFPFIISLFSLTSRSITIITVL